MSRFRILFNRNFVVPSTLCACYFLENIRRDFDHVYPHKPVCENSGFKVHCKQRDEDIVSKYTLQSVSVFFRHGARTPLSHLPGVEEVIYDKNKLRKIPPHTDVPVIVQTLDGKARPASRIEDRYKTVNFKGGMYAGNLTTLGREQAYALGKTLRKRYIEDQTFISDVYKQQETFIRSTNIDRCIDSLQCVLAGLYGKKSFKEPVIIPVASGSSEILLPNFRYCNTLRQLDHKTPKYLDEQNGLKFVSHYIKYFTNQKSDKHLGMMQWRDHVAARQAHGLEIPLWLEAIQAQLDRWATKSLEIYSCGVPQDRVLILSLVAGPMLHLVSTNFKRAIENHKRAKKLSLYSCHDSSLVPLMNALSIFDQKWPPYSSDVTMELYKDEEGDYFVKLSFLSEDITFPGYDTPMIPYEKFEEMIAPYIVDPAQYSQRCHDIDLAKEHSKRWETVIMSHEQEDDGPDEENEVPPNM